MMLLPVHIAGGAVAIVAGFVALHALKGAKLHRESGMVFVGAMLVMSVTGALIAVMRPNGWGTALSGLLAFYMVATGLLTMRRRGTGFDRIDLGATLFGLTLGLTYVTFGLQALASPTGMKDGYPPPLYFIFGTVTLLAAWGDIRMMLAGLPGTRRVARHLWRMCFATFIATGSFFLGQAKVFPESIRIVPLLAISAVAPLVLMLYWLARASGGRRYSRA